MSAKKETKNDKLLIPPKIKNELFQMSYMMPHFIIFTVFFTFPFVFGLIISLHNWNIYNSSMSTYVGLKNYNDILFNQESIFYKYFWQGLGNTLFFVAVSVPFLIVIPLFIAILLDNEPPGYKIFRTILFMPTVFSISAVILMWRWQFNTNGGFINAILKGLNLGEISFVNTQPWAWIAIFVVTVWWTMGTNMVILGAGLKNIDKTMYEAAAIDGASYFRRLISITIPSLSGQLILISIMTILASFNIYGQPELLTGGGPEYSTTVLMMRIRGLVSGLNARPGVATSMAIMMGIIMITVSLIQAAIIRKRSKN